MLTAEQQALSNEATRMANHQDPAYTTKPGECAQVQRIITSKVLGVSRSWQPGPDADGVADLLAARGCEVTDQVDIAQVGDLLVWTEGHGPHGHIAMRVLGNRIAENSTIHYNENGDARGFRPLSAIDPNYRVFRLWQ